MRCVFFIAGSPGSCRSNGFQWPQRCRGTVCVIFLYDTLITSMLHVWLSVRLICLGHFYFYFSFCFSLVFFLLGAFLIKQLFHFCQLGATSLISYLLTSKEAQVIYYTVIKHNGHLRTWGKCRKQEPQTSLFCISRVFSRSYLYNIIFHIQPVFVEWLSIISARNVWATTVSLIVSDLLVVVCLCKQCTCWTVSGVYILVA